MATLQEHLHKSVAELRSLLGRHSTRSVAGWCFSPNITAQQERPDKRLHSPDRQISFLVALLLSTPEPDAPTDLSEADWNGATTLLNEIFSAYFQLYFPTADERGKVTSEWRRIREVSMAAFFHYFSSGLVASVEQIVERIAAYTSPFDDELKLQVGITASEAAEICRFITDKLQNDLDRLGTATSEEESRREALLERADSESLSVEDLKDVAWKEPWAEKAIDVLDGLQRLGLVTFAELEAAFPSTAHRYWKQFTIARGEGPEIQYPTEPSVFDTRPLIRMDDETVFCAAANTLFSAVLKTAEESLLGSRLREKYLRARDKALEREVTRYARTLFGKDVRIWQGVYETPDSQHEHDVIAFDEHLCIVFEAKASPPPEPLRDPEKAFARIRDGFRAGIQKAYEQGNRIVGRLRKEEVVRLFDDAGHEVGQLLPSSSRFIGCACVTRDDFGALATNLSLLLEKPAEDAYPWAVNISDLSTLAEAWGYFGWGSRELRDYLEQRLKLHGKVLGGYELDYAGAFIQHGRFAGLRHCPVEH